MAETVSTFQLIGNQFDGWKSHIPFFADFSGDFGQGVFSCTKTKPGKHLGEMELNSTHHTITGMTNTHTQKGEKPQALHLILVELVGHLRRLRRDVVWGAKNRG